MATLNLVEAGIDSLQDALSSGSISSVELVALYLRRISKYDCRNTLLNSIPILNPHVFEEAAASDDRRASGQAGRLEGIPFTVKDSFKVKGMTVSCGSPAFKSLISNEDAFTVSSIRAAGGVLIGKTNMPSMAYGGMQRGIYGRAESPYNPEFLAAAFASGSSNGSGVSTAASLAAFGMGEETVSSGRSPASNNALVAYTPSRGWISIRGNWPLYPTCDVVVPHTRTMSDMLTLLEVISAKDPVTEGDYWRSQPYVSIPEPWGGKPSANLFQNISKSVSLEGLRIAVPEMYIGGRSPEWATPVTTSEGVITVWGEARKKLESLGAEIVLVPDFPAVTAYENPELLQGVTGLPERWQWTEKGPLIAHGWDLFLRSNGDPNVPNIASVDEQNIYPDSMRTSAELENQPTQNSIHWGKLAEYVREGTGSMFDIKNLDAASIALESMRKQLSDDSLERYGCDCYVFPAAGDVGSADADVDSVHAAHAWANGVFYSTGNRALRHLGIPTVTVPMGMIPGKGMPVGLTFAGRGFDDENLLKWANAFETQTKLRSPPPHTPALPSDLIQFSSKSLPIETRPHLLVTKCISKRATETAVLRVEFEGTIDVDSTGSDRPPAIQVSVDGQDIPDEQITIDRVANESREGHDLYVFRGWEYTPGPPERNEKDAAREQVCGDQIMVVFLARTSPGGLPAGFLRLI
ncbi:unnamed protein product [Clonostachys chloroleuca]|uniref:Amidase domain-containing protein n=1 Tax=Clonostachys chloroleuca TaxID=1926264 RepID=A0AA35Q735_9HYPO|nr:unnamed protein product [Clonostachys chloroleuca]